MMAEMILTAVRIVFYLVGIVYIIKIYRDKDK